MIKKLTKKSLSIILCVTVLLSCMVFAMPTANAAADTYYYSIRWKMPTSNNFGNSYKGGRVTQDDSAGFTISYKSSNGTSNSVDYLNLDIKDLGGNKNTDEHTSTGSCSGFPCALFAAMDDNRAAVFGGTAEFEVYEFKIGPSLSDLHTVWKGKMHIESVYNPYATEVIAGNTTTITDNPIENGDDPTVSTDEGYDTLWKYPYAATPGTVSISPATITLDGTSSKSTTITKPTGKDQYGVQMVSSLCTISYSTPVYNPTAFELNTAGSKLTVSKDAHISEEGTNSQTVQIKGQWTSAATDAQGNPLTESATAAKLTVEDEKYTAVYKWYESNESTPASPTEKTQSVTGIYYGDFPEDEQIPEPIDNYYTDTQHFTNGQFPTVPTNNTYTMLYSSAPHSMLTKVEDEATCQGAGTTKHYCNCGYYYIETGTPAQVDHDYVPTVVEPTCTEDGYTLNVCRFCGDSYTSNPVDALGHNERRQSITPATCTEPGQTVYECRRCGNIRVEPIPAKGHDFASKVIAPTCTEGGYTEHVCKNRCGTTYTDTLTDPLGHDHQLIENTPATCTTAGREVYKCSRCDDSYTIDHDALGHDFSTSKITTPATCTEDGVLTYYCSRCDEVDPYPIQATGHDYQKTVVAPTCANQGYDLYICSKCQDEYIENYTDALGHDWDNGTVTQEPTCTVDGVKTFNCSRCTETRTEPITAPGHNYKLTEIVEPTCTEKGYTVFTCENCPDTYNANETDALGHNFSTNKITTEPTCTEKGVRTYYCSRCDATQEEPVDALGHNYIPTVVAPTCTEQGYTEYQCSRCEDNYKDNYIDSLGGHLFTDYFFNEDATCTKDGTETAICDRCDATDTRTVEGSALGHDFATYVYNEDATCTENGTETAKCERCDVTDTRTAENTALGHQFTTYVYNEDATCTENGTETAKCERCDVTDTRTAENTALGHQFTTYVYNEDATCTQNGTETAKCDRCDVTDTRTVENSALGHDYITNTVNPTCKESGYTETTCSRCDYYNKQITAEPLGHDFGDWQTSKEPSCGVPGENIRYCSRCEEFETEPVAALEHQWTQIVEDPSNETNGYVYYHCDNCSKYANAVVSAENTATVGEDLFESIDSVKAETLEISAPTFNKYYNTEQEYDYSTRGAALKYSDPTYIDDYTTQDTRFTASLFIPSNIDVTFSGASDNKLTDFGFVFAQTSFIEDASELVLDSPDAYSISVPERNQGAGDISNWNGVSVHDDTFGGSTLTFNLLLKIKAINWTKDYCARAYVTYTQNGFTYTVYDGAYASRSVADIARAVVESETESQEAKEYCQTKILNNLNVY